MSRETFVVAVYNSGLRYGGPEEGDWWYEAGELIRTLKTFRDEDQAYSYCNRLNRKLGEGVGRDNPGLNGRLRNYPMSSSIADEFLVARVFPKTAPEGYPETTPHYE